MQISYLLSDSRWEEPGTIIEPKPRKRKTALRVITSGIIYLLENGCKWEGLPGCYGYYKTVWYYYNKWMRYGILEQALYKLSVKVHTCRQHRKAEPTLVIVDSQSAKIPFGTSETTGYDANKKVKERKRHIAFYGKRTHSMADCREDARQSVQDPSPKVGGRALAGMAFQFQTTQQGL